MVANDQAVRENDCSQARSQLAQQQNTPLGLLLGGTAFVLILLVTLLALASIERNERAMSRLLAEKGSSLIMAFESMLRTSMRGEARVRLQILLKEMASTSDVQFIAVTMPDGTILAHSNGNRLGEILRINGEEADEKTMKMLAPGSRTRSAVLNMEGQQLPPGLPQPVIFLGLDLSPFEITRSQDRDHVFMLAGVAMLVGLACLLALYYAQRARESRRRQRRAEGEIRRLEEEIRRKEKLAAVGTLAAGVAHEIRNPLSSIKGYATYFGMRFPEGSEDRKAAGVMVREVERLNRVISELIGLSRPSDVRPVAAPLEDSVAHVLRLIAQDAEKRGVRLVNSLPADLPPARMDPDRLGQALLNICLNALDAMPGGGTLTLDCTVEKQHLVLSVTDTGQGIAPGNLSHIFDPYFTTKGHGTGLGLATVHKIVEALGGEVYVQSRQAPAGPRFSYACRRPARRRAIRRTARTGRPGGLPPTGRRGRTRVNTSILVVDDDDAHRGMLRMMLQAWGYSVDEAADGDLAVEAVRAKPYDVVLTDVRMGRMDGIHALRGILDYNPALPVVLMTAYSSVETAVEALRLGAYDYLTKPLDFDALRETLQRAVDHSRMSVENRELRRQLSEAAAGPEILGRSPAISAMREIIATVAPTEATVLITGESGTGKELVARAVHGASARAGKPLVTVNCAALAENLLESELFGHERGAFTGADRRREGRFLQADGGTLFLDEIGEMPLSLQAKLLRALQQGEVQRVGSDSPITVDVRVIAATNRNLQEEVEQKRFREDLFFRLNVISIEVPPLRERSEDIITGPELPASVTGAAEQAAPATETAEASLAGLSLEALERRAIEDTLRQTEDNKSEAARRLGITRATLHNKLRKYGLE